MCIESPQKARYHLTERIGMISCLRFRITNVVFLKCQNLVKTKEKLKEKLKPIHPYRKASFLGVHPHKYATVSFSTKSTLESVSKSCVLGINFIVYAWTITVPITKKVAFSCGRSLNKVAVARF